MSDAYQRGVGVHLDAQLFPEFASERLCQRFARVQLAAGELP